MHAMESQKRSLWSYLKEDRLVHKTELCIIHKQTREGIPEREFPRVLTLCARSNNALRDPLLYCLVYNPLGV